jgi:imidazolonepropionase-like amidohydrolase
METNNFKWIQILVFIFFYSSLSSQFLLKPERIFDGFQMQSNWVVYVDKNKIKYTGPLSGMGKIAEGTKVFEMTGTTLMPGLIEGHSHILLHPYDETPWNDQVLKESPTERSIRAVVHLNRSLAAGITTMRDLGSEGAGYADVYIKESIEKGIIPGPRLLVAGPAIVATGSYGPKGFHDGVKVPLGANEADGIDGITKEVRTQIGNGVDFIKVYADYRWGPNGEAKATFSVEELELMVKLAESSGRYVVAHAQTEEGMIRSIMAGVETIEHGDFGNRQIFSMMAENNVAFCPTLAAVESILTYRGWLKGKDTPPDRVRQKQKSFRAALESGVKICFGGDVGVFSHGDNVKELELMVEYGMSTLAALRSATSLNAEIFHLDDKVGAIKEGMLADIIVVRGNPLQNISVLRQVEFVMKDGKVFKFNPEALVNE